MKESDLQALVWAEVSKSGRLFRANVGQAWTGNKIYKTDDGGLFIPEPRPFKTGLPDGFSDLFGIVPIRITNKHIGQTMGVFAAIEVKAPKGRIRPAQSNFIEQVLKLGGLAGIARSVEDARKIIDGGLEL